MNQSLTTGNGVIINIPAATRDHMLAHPDVGDLLEEAAGLLVLNGEFLAKSVNLGRQVGLSACVPAPRIGLDDPATFVVRVNRPRPSRVLVGAEMVPTSEVSIIARPTEAGYELITAWIGPLAPREPADFLYTEEGARLEAVPAASVRGLLESLDFWSRYALVFDPGVATGEPFTSTWRAVLGL